MTPDTPTALPDLETLLAEAGAVYPLLGYAVQVDDEEIDPEALRETETQLDSVIFDGLVHP